MTEPRRGGHDPDDTVLAIGGHEPNLGQPAQGGLMQQHQTAVFLKSASEAVELVAGEFDLRYWGVFCGKSSKLPVYTYGFHNAS
jgi:hypothetical protein